MATRIFSESNYKFTDPIRYFKANDPYFWKVDNIPLKQLQENCNFLKDQVEALLSPSSSLFEVTREEIQELKPYVDGTDNKVKVKPGRFTARVNDAFNISPLQFITQVIGFNPGEINVWEDETVLGSSVSSVLQKFKSNLAVNALGMNGLAERAFTLPMQTNDIPSVYLPASSTQFDAGTEVLNPPYPNVTGQIWVNNAVSLAVRKILNFHWNDPSWGYTLGGIAESDFIKRWRGVARTAIVNVEEELEIDIPPFDDNDFYYIDENGTKVLVEASQRIDLVFIYTKPIDMSGTTINRFDSGIPTVITRPTLGIVKGAGIGISLQRGTTDSNLKDKVSLLDANGNSLILPHAGDESVTTIGVGDIKGSFPSPDDLMNLSPLLAENLSTDHIALVGQSILPVAYVSVRKTAELNENNLNVIVESDLLDIRPFFRTAELTYNERAGIAAATPQVSLSNPVATEGYVDYTAKILKDDYTSRFAQVEGVVNAQGQIVAGQTLPRMIGCGYVLGGYNYGVEGALGDYVTTVYNLTNKAQAKTYIKANYGYPQALSIQDYPDWDIAEWCKQGNYSEKGYYPNDYINFHFFDLAGKLSDLEFGAYSNKDFTTRIKNLGRGTNIFFVKKTIQIDRSQVQWAQDYTVDVQLLNCAPMSNRVFTNIENSQPQTRGAASVWVDKKSDSFTIFVAWAATWGLQTNSPMPHTYRNEGDQFASFSVITYDMLGRSYVNKVVNGEASAGAAIYPSIAFQVNGIPQNYQGFATNLHPINPILTLK